MAVQGWTFFSHILYELRTISTGMTFSCERKVMLHGLKANLYCYFENFKHCTFWPQ